MPRSSKIFRLFISSTFSDLKHERTALQQHVFPVIEELCQKYGAKFQAIDLRWGVSQEAQLDHKTLDICLRELRRCQELSPRPNFLVLLGNRYGWRPVPAKLEKREFEEISHFFEQKCVDEHAFLHEWYKEDLNSVPVSYYLQPRTGKYIDTETWAPVEQKLRALFDEIIEVLPMDEKRKARYNLSATDHEIREGAFKQDRAEEHVFAFFRDFTNVCDKEKTAEFFDLHDDGSVNERAVRQITSLRTELQEYLPAKNIHHYSLDWAGGEIDSEYLSAFCRDVLASLIPVVERECKEIEDTEFVIKETEIHHQFAISRSKNFIGREQLFHSILEDFRTGKQAPIVVEGASGSGKSAFVAELYKRIKRDFPQANVMARFIGASAFGMNSIELHQSVLAQLLPSQQEEILGASQLDQLLLKRNEAFQQASNDQPLIMIIDAIDQMTDYHLLAKWLMSTLPPHVYIILTVATDQKAYRLIKGMIDEEHFYPIEPLKESEGRDLMTEWLLEEGRILQSEQAALLMKAFKSCPLPLFLKLAFEEARLWHSYTIVQNFPETIDGMIQQFINRLADRANHGEILVFNVLGLLASARSGLDEGEIIDLLSLVPEVMEDFDERAMHEYMDNKLPMVIWARLYNDLEPYIIEKNENGRLLYSFYHRQIEEQVKSSFVNERFHRMIADYFDHQPIYYGRIPNIRKCSELPFQLNKSRELQKLANTLGDFLFLQAKFQAGLSQDLLKDFEQAKRIDFSNYQDTELKIIEDFERLCQVRHSILRKYPERIGKLALQLPEHSRAYQLAERWHKEKNQPVLQVRNRTSSNDRSLHIFETGDSDIKACEWHPDPNYIIMASGSLLKVWNIHTGEDIYQFNPNLGQIISLSVSYANNCLAICGQNHLEVLHLDSFETVYQLEAEEEILQVSCHPGGDLYAAVLETGQFIVIDLKTLAVKKTKTSNDQIVKAVWHPNDPLLAVWHGNGSVEIWKLGDEQPAGSYYTPFRTENQLFSTHYDLGFDGDGLLYMGQNQGVTVWDMKDGLRVRNTDHLHHGMHLVSEGSIVSLMNNGQISVWDGKSGNVRLNFRQHHFKVPKLAALREHSLAVINQDGKVSIWNLRPNEQEEGVVEDIPFVQDDPLWVFKPFVTFIPQIIGELNHSKYSLTRKAGVSTQMWESVLLSSALSPAKAYVASGHMGKYLQVQTVGKKETTRYMPPKSDVILFCEWSHDERMIFYGTHKRAWVMNFPSGKIRKTIVSKHEIAGGKWSPSENKLVILYRNGEAELIDTESDSSECWSLVSDNSLSMHTMSAAWSPSGKKLAVSCDQTFCLYELYEKPEMVMIGELTTKVTHLCWGTKEDVLLAMNERYEMISINILEKKVDSHFDLISPEEYMVERDYYVEVQNDSRVHLEDLKSMMKQYVNEMHEDYSKVEEVMAMLGSFPVLSLNNDSTVLAAGVGNWLKVIPLKDPGQSAIWYLENFIYDIRWENEKLFIYDGNKNLAEFQMIGGMASPL